jgi:hypothetical protein
MMCAINKNRALSRSLVARHDFSAVTSIRFFGRGKSIELGWYRTYLKHLQANILVVLSYKLFSQPDTQSGIGHSKIHHCSLTQSYHFQHQGSR